MRSRPWLYRCRWHRRLRRLRIGKRRPRLLLHLRTQDWSNCAQPCRRWCYSRKFHKGENDRNFSGAGFRTPAILASPHSQLTIFTLPEPSRQPARSHPKVDEPMFAAMKHNNWALQHQLVKVVSALRPGCRTYQ